MPAARSLPNSALRNRLIAVAALAFILTPIFIVVADALGFAREGFRADLPILGIFIGAALALLGVSGVDAWLKRQ